MANDFILPSGSNFIPETDSVDDLGSDSKYFNNLYVNNIFGGNTGSLNKVPCGKTVIIPDYANLLFVDNLDVCGILILQGNLIEVN
jgi:hypothetical protein